MLIVKRQVPLQAQMVKGAGARYKVNCKLATGPSIETDVWTGAGAASCTPQKHCTTGVGKLIRRADSFLLWLSLPAVSYNMALVSLSECYGS
eukprot:scaffold121367_cov19-Tisochrysis_lutea.AAC.2